MANFPVLLFFPCLAIDELMTIGYCGFPATRSSLSELFTSSDVHHLTRNVF